MLRATRIQALAYRLDGHGLTRRQPLDRLVDIAGKCGIRDTPPGSAALALQARVSDLTPDRFSQALNTEKSLVDLLGMRISPWVVPARDLALFTLGSMPREEVSLRAILPQLTQALDRAGMTAGEAVELAVEAGRSALDGQPLSRAALSQAITARLPEVLSPWCKPCGV